MGCPDWPKCFGSYVPPTKLSQLPEGYEQVFQQKRLEKVQRFAALLKSTGFSDLATQLKEDRYVNKMHAFNPFNTWVEYLNRLLGVVVGLLILIQMWWSLKVRGKGITIPYLGIAIFVITVLQGLVGAVVVATNLIPFTISIHMVLALAIVLMITILVYRTGRFDLKEELNQVNLKGLLALSAVLLVGMVIQLWMGLEIRQGVDLLVAEHGESWRLNLKSAFQGVFYFHRSFSLLLASGILFLGYRLHRSSLSLTIKRMGYALGGFVILEVLAGAIMFYFNIPSILQPVHMTLSVLMIGFIFHIMLYFRDFNRVSYVA